MPFFLRKEPSYATTTETMFLGWRLVLVQAQCQLTPEAEAELTKLRTALAEDEKMLAKVSTERKFPRGNPPDVLFRFVFPRYTEAWGRLLSSRCQLSKWKTPSSTNLLCRKFVLCLALDVLKTYCTSSSLTVTVTAVSTCISRSIVTVGGDDDGLT